MKKTILLAIMLLCAIVALTACSAPEQERFQVVTATQNNPLTSTVQPINVPSEETLDMPIDFDSGEYDPSSEEGGDFEAVPDVPQPVVTPAPTMNSEYAGATPVVIDPIDKPTPTPVPPITIGEFTLHDAYKLHVTFEGPASWTLDDSASDTYILTNPDTSVDYQAQLIVKTVAVSSSYSKHDLTKECKNMLNEVKKNFRSFSPSQTAERTLIDHTGIYANFTAKTEDGAEVAGRVHVTYVNKTLYEVIITYPLAYRDTYVDKVYGQLRHTIAITQ